MMTLSAKLYFFGDRPEIAKMYGANVQEAYVTIKKPFIISEKTPDDTGQVAPVAQYGGVKKFREALKKGGYDGIVIEKGYGKEILPFDESQIRVAQQYDAQVAYCDPSDISSMGRIKTGSLEKVFDRIPDGTTEPRGFFVKKNGKIWPTEKATPDILKRSMIDLNPDGSLREGCFMYSKIAFTEDVALERGRKE